MLILLVSIDGKYIFQSHPHRCTSCNWAYFSFCDSLCFGVLKQMELANVSNLLFLLFRKQCAASCLIFPQYTQYHLNICHNICLNICLNISSIFAILLAWASCCTAEQRQLVKVVEAVLLSQGRSTHTGVQSIQQG